MNIFSILFYQPLYNILIVLYRVFGGDLGLAIITVAALARIITFPITKKQIEMAETSQDFSKKVKEVQKKYKDDKEKQNTEMMKIQSEYLPGQLSGCFGMIFQLIILFNIFSVIRNASADIQSFNDVAYPFVSGFADGEMLNTNFFGLFDLSTTAGAVAGGDFLGNWMAVAPYVILAVLVGATQFFSARILSGLRKKRQGDTDTVKSKKSKKKKAKKGVKPEDQPEDFGEILQKSTQQTMFIIPFVLFFSALNFPAALGIYWTVQNGFVIIQQLILDKLITNKNGSNTSS